MPYYRWNFGADDVAEQAFKGWLKSGNNIVSFSIGKGIIVLFEDGSWGWVGVTKHLDNKLRGRQKTLPPPTYVITDVGNRYYIHFADGERKWKASRSFSRAINYSKSTVANVAFAPRNGWYIRFKDGTSAWNHLPKELHLLLKKKKKEKENINAVSISHDSYWFVSYHDNSYDCSLPGKCQEALKSLLENCNSNVNSTIIKNVFMGKRGAFCILYDIPGTLSKLHTSQISFSVNMIPPHFDSKQSLWQTVSNLEKKLLTVDMFPVIRVIKQNNKWISLDNRRLFVFQNAVNSEIPVLIIPQYYATFESYRSVNVSECKCKLCVFGQSQNKSTAPSKSSQDDSYARSYAWSLFLKEKKPPSALLLANSCILPSVHPLKVADSEKQKIIFQKQKKSHAPAFTSSTKRTHTIDNLSSRKKWKGSTRGRTFLQHIHNTIPLTIINDANSTSGSEDHEEVESQLKVEKRSISNGSESTQGCNNKKNCSPRMRSLIPLKIINDYPKQPLATKTLVNRHYTLV